MMFLTARGIAEIPDDTMPLAQATFPYCHDPELRDGKSIIRSSGSIIASDWVTYVDERADDHDDDGDICSMAGSSPDRNMRAAFPKDASGVILSSVDDSKSNISFVQDNDDTTPPDIHRVTTPPNDPSSSSFLDHVSDILDQSLLSSDGDYRDVINRKIESWDADIKSSVRQLDVMHGIPRGLAFSMAKKCKTSHCLRLFLIDNNGSTSQGNELSDCLEQHIGLSNTMDVSSVFCLLNSPDHAEPYSISSLSAPLSVRSTTSTLTSSFIYDTTQHTLHDDVHQQMIQMIQRSRKMKKAATIPWSTILRDAGYRIESADALLHHHQQSIVVCIVTDEFIITDEIASELCLLQRLPAKLVIRLIGTTGRESHNMTTLRDTVNILGLSHMIRVLGDVESHQLLIRRFNPWVRYGAPLHRYQELGLHSRTVALLSEQSLHHYELREFLVLLFGRHVMLEAPDVQSEWPAFLRYIKFVNTTTPYMWLDMNELNRMYGQPESRSFLRTISELRSQSQYSATQVEL